MTITTRTPANWMPCALSAVLLMSTFTLPGVAADPPEPVHVFFPCPDSPDECYIEIVLLSADYAYRPHPGQDGARHFLKDRYLDVFFGEFELTGLPWASYGNSNGAEVGFGQSCSDHDGYTSVGSITVPFPEACANDGPGGEIPVIREPVPYLDHPEGTSIWLEGHGCIKIIRGGSAPPIVLGGPVFITGPLQQGGSC